MPGFPQLEGRVVAITGASSGIGRATARAFAAKNASVVLAARNREQLEDVAEECRNLGCQALVLPTDVTDADAVHALAHAAVGTFGRIDVWINNAGVGVIGSFPDTPLELHRRTIEVDLLGAFHGAYAALPRFIAQGEGILINNISLGGWSPPPYAAAYAAAKFGLRALTSSLRQEMAVHPRIHVCGVFPALIDTPGLASAANMTGKAINAGPYLYDAEDVARTFVALVRRPRDEVAVGWMARAAQISFAMMPTATERIGAAVMRKALSKAGPAPISEGALLATTTTPRRSDGGWRRAKAVPSARTLDRALLASTAVAAAALAVFVRRRTGRSSGGSHAEAQAG